MGLNGTRKRIGELCKNLFSATTQPSTRRGVLLVAILLLLNVTTGITVLLLGVQYPILLGFSLLAWGFGLRHAMDADHISAIDNATRRLLYRGRPSVAVGFFFALGHSTIVFLLSAFVVFFVVKDGETIDTWKNFGQAVGAITSSTFLLLIGILNTLVLMRLLRAWRGVSRGEENTYHGHMHIGGPIEKIFRPLIRLVDKSYKMYFVGFLFGLGFDTATEIGLLALSALAAESIPPITILVLPLAFFAGMAILDTLNGLLMLGIYSWGTLRDKDRLRYNISVTALSALSGLLIGGTIGLQFLSRHFNKHDGVFAIANHIQLDYLGYALVALFITSWVVAYLGFRKPDLVES